jgi:hypothetical protein
MNVWKTKTGKVIPFFKLETSYIENILKKLKADSKKGVEIVYCFGLCDDDDYETGDCETVYGKEYLERTDYYELKKELKRRRINLRRKK